MCVCVCVEEDDIHADSTRFALLSHQYFFLKKESVDDERRKKGKKIVPGTAGRSCPFIWKEIFFFFFFFQKDSTNKKIGQKTPPFFFWVAKINRK